MGLPYKGPSDPEDIKGSKMPTQQASRRRWVKGIGWTTVEIWEGPTEDGVFGRAQELILAGYTEVEFFQVRHGVWRVEGSTPTEGQGVPGEDPIDEWTLDSFAELRPVQDNPYFSTLSAANILAIESAVNDGEGMPDLGSSPLNVTGLKLYNLLAKGTKTYYAEQPILRHVMTFATFDDVSFSMANTLKYHTQASLPSGIASAVQVAINSIPYGVAISGMAQGWMKMPTVVRQNIFTRAEIVEEWRFGYWETILYS